MALRYLRDQEQAIIRSVNEIYYLSSEIQSIYERINKLVREMNDLTECEWHNEFCELLRCQRQQVSDLIPMLHENNKRLIWAITPIPDGRSQDAPFSIRD